MSISNRYIWVSRSDSLSYMDGGDAGVGSDVFDASAGPGPGVIGSADGGPGTSGFIVGSSDGGPGTSGFIVGTGVCAMELQIGGLDTDAFDDGRFMSLRTAPFSSLFVLNITVNSAITLFNMLKVKLSTVVNVSTVKGSVDI
jgi:hypothetical protein